MRVCGTLQIHTWSVGENRSLNNKDEHEPVLSFELGNYAQLIKIGNIVPSVAKLHIQTSF
jgi:hypothetical protein